MVVGIGEGARYVQFRAFFHQIPQRRNQRVIQVLTAAERTAIDHRSHGGGLRGTVWGTASGHEHEPRGEIILCGVLDSGGTSGSQKTLTSERSE